MKGIPNYSVLAPVYDVVMAHVDYEDWSLYMQELILQYHPDARSILELGCGTGSLALQLQPFGDYRYLATDGSPEMISVARRKAAIAGSPVRFEVAEFTTFPYVDAADVVILLFDGINYLTEPHRVVRLLEKTYLALKPGGLFLFDQSTPANSINNEAFFEDHGQVGDLQYVRHSWFDRDLKSHITTFDFEVEGRQLHERHVQRAWDESEMRACIDKTSFEVLGLFDGFSDEPARPDSERLQWVLRRS